MTEIDRRRLLAALAGFALAPTTSAHAAPTTHYLGARFGDGDAASVAIFTDDGAETAAAPLPTRGHGLAGSPDGRLLVVMARRPQRWGVVFDRDTLTPLARLTLPEDRHFYGHGCFAADGTRFYTTENDTDGGDGVIGIWDATRGFIRLGERRSGGVGPHDLALMPDGRHLVVANGGIRTHPATGRDILNRAAMRPNLALLALEREEIVATADLGAELRLSSIRHLCVASDGEVAFGCQFEGDRTIAPLLVGSWRPGRSGSEPRLWEMPDPALARLADYVGSVALDVSGTIVAATSPRGGTTVFFERASGRFLGLASLPDVCGVAGAVDGFVVTSGAAGGRRITSITGTDRTGADLGAAFARHAWDNHLLRLG